jgi:hypothetical protein
VAEQRANTWLEAWRRAVLDRPPDSRQDSPWLWILAAQAGTDPSLARRMAIVEILLDGRPHPALALQTAVKDRLGENCFGAQAAQMLEADVAALGDWGIRIGHSDTPGMDGYYLKDPAVQATGKSAWKEAVNSVQVQIRRSMDDARKMHDMFEMFEFALHQVEIGTRSRHPDWDDEKVEAEVRRLVTGVESASLRRE